MKTNKIWLNKFNPDWDFVCNKPLLSMGSVKYKAGDPVDKSLVSERRLKLLYESRKLAPVFDEVEVSVDEKPAPIANETATPEIVGPQKGGWFKVMLGDEQIGDSTRSPDEAELIVMEWEDARNNEGEA